ncbi:MAG TPA: hypothetical protein VFC92_00540 [Bacteroidales bacterium]|nr:hypothetical protein [Bacteroidales bacterium]
MIKIKKAYTAFAMVLAAFLLLTVTSCKKDDSPARETSYTLKTQDVLGVTGTVTFIETSSTTSTITIKLSGAPSGSHPAALYSNSIAEGGTIVQVLNPVDASGTSSTEVNSLTYNQLIVYDGFVKVVKSSTEPNVILAQGDIGGNVLTALKKTYTMDTIGTFGVSGIATFEKRVNGNTLVTLDLSGVIAEEVYPAAIHVGSITTTGPVTKTLSSVDGTTGKSYTNISKLNSGEVITYDTWLVYAGYINIYQTAVAPNNIICHGNIGAN